VASLVESFTDDHVESFHRDGFVIVDSGLISEKALDLLRDSRVVVHSVTCDRDGRDGDLKLYGHAVDIRDASLRQTFREAMKARIDWAPDEPSYHLFSIDIDRAAFVKFGNGQQIMVWDPARGLRTRRKQL